MNRKAKILFIDPDEEIRDILAKVLQSVPEFEIPIVTSLEEASERLAQQGMDGVIVDGMFPVDRLLDFLSRIRTAYPHLPMVVLVVEVDMIVDERFKQALELLRVRSVPKVGLFEETRLKELLEWCYRH
ncbi:MAG: hypothetical protein NC930_01565 [Candidatus Omnitrophica bacterium]|nr:hypothetical protein [Candidatus Omnitrophota bacterium]